MKKYIALYLLAAAVLPDASAAESPVAYWDSAFGFRPYRMPSAQTPPALSKALLPEKQISSRYPGVATSEPLLEQLRKHNESRGEGLGGGWRFFPSSPQKLMPYLDSVFVPGNSCCEPCALVKDDPVSRSAQRLKTALSEYGLQYSMLLTANYSGMAPVCRAGRNDFVSFNNEVSGICTLAKDGDGSQAVFLSFEADWGQAVRFSERNSSVESSIGSLCGPQGSLRGGKGVFIPNLALGYSGFEGKWIGMIGTLDATNYLDQNAYSASWAGNLLNRSFNFNPALPLEWANWGYLTAFQPCRHFYAMYATTGTNAPINHNPFPYISSRAWVHLGEFGFIHEDLLGMGAATYRLQYTISRTGSETGSGAALNLQQQLGHDSPLGFFSRCAYLDSDAASLSGLKACATGGFVLQAPFRSHGWGSLSNSEQIACGFLWQRAAASERPYAHKDEYGVELSAVWQLTPTLSLQPDLQCIFSPVHQTDRGHELVFQLQSIFRF